MFMCNNAWSGSKSAPREVSKLKKLLITLICLMIGTGTAGVAASAGPVTSMMQASALNLISDDAAATATDALPLMDANGGFRPNRAMGRRAYRTLRKPGDAGRGGFGAVAPLIRVAGASSAKRAAERAAGGRAVRVVKKGGRFIVTVVSGGSARRCVVDAQSGRVLGCR